MFKLTSRWLSRLLSSRRIHIIWDRLYYTWVICWRSQSQEAVVWAVVSIAYKFHCVAWSWMLHLQQQGLTVHYNVS